MSRAALRLFRAFVEGYDDADRWTVWTSRGGYESVSKADLRAVLAMAERSEELGRALKWAHDALMEAKREGLLGSSEPDASDAERAADDEFERNMEPIRAALRLSGRSRR